MLILVNVQFCHSNDVGARVADLLCSIQKIMIFFLQRIDQNLKFLRQNFDCIGGLLHVANIQIFMKLEL